MHLGHLRVDRSTSLLGRSMATLGGAITTTSRCMHHHTVLPQLEVAGLPLETRTVAFGEKNNGPDDGRAGVQLTPTAMTGIPIVGIGGR